MDRLESIEKFGQYLRRQFPGRRTAIDYVSDVHQFANVCFKEWHQVTMQDIDIFVDQQREAGRGQATINRRVAALKTFFDFVAEESGELSRANPVRFKRHAGKQPKSLPRDLSDETVEKVWQVITSLRDRAWFVLMWRAGLRVGEIVALKVSDELVAPQAERPARLRVRGKGQKERIVLLTADAYAVLTAWLQVRPESAEAWVFLNERGEALTANGIQWLLHRYGERVGVELTPHQLRHTYARQLTEAGMPITSLSKLMGHSQVSTTQIYTAGADPQLVQAYQSAMQHLETRASPAPEKPVLVSRPAEAGSMGLPDAASLPTEFIPPLPDWTEWMPDLPTELRQASLAYVQGRLATCKPKHQRRKAMDLLGRLRSFWLWQQARRPISHLADLHLADLRARQECRLAENITPVAINRDLDFIMGILREQADRGVPVDNSVFRLRRLACPDSLPRYLDEADMQCLERYVLDRLQAADPIVRLENACFFVLAHTGVRASECADLLYQDLDLPAKRLIIRQGKGLRDRVVYLSDLACRALQLYLDGSPRCPTTPLWLRQNAQPISDDWLREHIAALGQAAGVSEVKPHRLRHTLATRLLNAGMDVTRIQKLLGHENISTTMIYARVLDTTVEADYRQSMRKVELQQTPLSNTPISTPEWPTQTIDEHFDQIVKEQLCDTTHYNQLDNSV
jgi:integrase/recombinase XerD